MAAVHVVTAAHKLGSVWWEDRNTEAVPEGTGAQTRVPDEMEVADGENLLALSLGVVVYGRSTEDAESLPSCHSLMPNEWGNRCSFGLIVQNWEEVLRT